MTRYLGNLHALLSEAPITDIGTLGNFQKPGSFRKAADKALISSPGRLEAIKKAWGKSASDFRLYFANFKRSDMLKWREHGVLSPEEIDGFQESMNQMLPFEAGDDCVTIIFTNNDGDEWRAMTPWIMAHRVGHALRSSRNDRGITEACDELQKYVEQTLDELGRLSNVRPDQFQPNTAADKRRSGDYFQSDYIKTEGRNRMRRAVAHAHGAMRSARSGNLRNHYEFVYDTVAQYLITGRVYLDKEHRPVTVRKNWGRAETRSANKDGTEAIETLKRDFSIEVPHYIDNIMAHATGKILVM